jgi:hypothetical protein
LGANTFAEIVAGWMAAGFKQSPRFRRRRRADGEFEAYVKAPRGSKAGSLVVLTDKGNLWLRFAPPRMFCSADSRAELMSIIRGLLGERIVFVITYRGDEWRGTMLMGRRGVVPRPRRGEIVTVMSWSGRYDRVVQGKVAAQV